MPYSRRAFLAGACGGAALAADARYLNAAPGTGSAVCVIVERRLAKALGRELDRHSEDLAAEGFKSRRYLIAAGTPPSETRARLADAGPENVAGAVLVGNVPSPQANANAIARAGGMREMAAPSQYWHSHPCDAYYMNLRGDWRDADGDGVLDVWDGDRRPDLWVSRLRADTLTNTLGMSEAELLRRYFNKNHQYRRGRLAIPPRRALVTWYTMDVLRSQKEGGWGCTPELLYGRQVEVFGGMSEAEQAERGYRRLVTDDDGFELGVINCVTFWDRHQFDKAEFTWDWVRAAKPKRVLWYHMLTSEPGRHDHENYLAGIYLFSDTPTQVLFCGSQHSGVVAAPSIYPDLAAGETFGEAFRRAFQYETDRWGQTHSYYANWSKSRDRRVNAAWGAKLPATVLHGDGTLRLPPRQSSR